MKKFLIIFPASGKQHDNDSHIINADTIGTLDGHVVLLDSIGVVAFIPAHCLCVQETRYEYDLKNENDTDK